MPPRQTQAYLKSYLAVFLTEWKADLPPPIWHPSVDRRADRTLVAATLSALMASFLKQVAWRRPCD